MEVNLSEHVDKMIGRYSAYGSHNSDMMAYKKLDEVDELLCHIMSVLCENVKNGLDSSSHSVNMVGDKSAGIISKIQCSYINPLSEYMKSSINVI